MSVVFGPIAFGLMYYVSNYLSLKVGRPSWSTLPRDQPRKHGRDKKVSVCSFYGDSRRSNGRSAVTGMISMLPSED